MIMAVVGNSIRKKKVCTTDSIKCALSERVCSYVLTPRGLNFNISPFKNAMC